MVPVYLLVEMGFDDSIVVQPEPFTERVLSDFEAPIHVAAQSGGEKETDGKGERSRLKAIHQGGAGGRLRQRDPHLLFHPCLVGTPG